MRIGGGGGEMVATDIRGWCERKWSTSEPAAACGPCGSDRLGPIGGPNIKTRFLYSFYNE
jgi:hypothetical protein